MILWPACVLENRYQTEDSGLSYELFTTSENEIFSLRNRSSSRNFLTICDNTPMKRINVSHRRVSRYLIVCAGKYINSFFNFGVRVMSIVRNNYEMSKYKNKGAQLQSKIPQLEIFYINLDSRNDRKRQIEREFSRLSIRDYCRISATLDANGRLGCAISHLETLQAAKNSNSALVMICEDDCQFIATRLEIERILGEFSSNNSLDVLCLAYLTLEKTKPISRSLSVTRNTQTMSCYVLKSHMINPMIEVANESIRRCAFDPTDYEAAIDQTWKNLQSKYIFVTPYRRFAIQRPSYSNITLTKARYGV